MKNIQKPCICLFVQLFYYVVFTHPYVVDYVTLMVLNINPQRVCTRVIVSYFFCVSVTDFGDGFVLSLQTGIKHGRRLFKGLNVALF